jgi:phosphoribosylformylglycinamidine synthase
MKSKIQITLKESILDPQGKTVQHALENLGYFDVTGVRIGKYIELNLKTHDRKKAEKETIEMCEKLLANLVIESYHFEIED